MKALALVAALALAVPAARAQRAQGEAYALFWRGDVRIIATRPDTRVTLFDIATGLPVDPATYSSAIRTNPFTLAGAGDSFEANNASATFHVKIVAEPAMPPSEPKPVIAWTGSIAWGLIHPAAPPAPGNAWVSNVPALSASSLESGTEIGREFWGFTSREMWIVAHRDPAAPTRITIEDLVTNTDRDADDTQTFDATTGPLVIRDAGFEIYFLESFEDDTFRLTSNVDVSVTAGIGSLTAPDWSLSPPSFGAGEDFRELGTLFVTPVGRDLTVFPTQDGTTVRITDLSDGDDSGTYTLAEGDLSGPYDILLTDDRARNGGSGLTARGAGPQVRLRYMGAAAPFENDIVRVEADKPVLVYVGPKATDQGEYADVAYAVRTGAASWLSYCYAQNGGARDYQMFVRDPNTGVSITSLTYSTGAIGGAHHDFLVPVTSPWEDGNAITNDWSWSSDAWRGELLRVVSDGPVTIISGDYDGWNFGCFVPFSSDGGLLRPVAVAGSDIAACAGAASVTLDGSASFDADFIDGTSARSWTWDVDPATDADGDGDPANDRDLAGPVVTFPLTGPGPWTITLTYSDDDGQSDTDVIVVSASDLTPPQIACSGTLTATADPATGTARVSVLASATDDCDAAPLLTNDRTASGRDATGDYPCGTTIVTFRAADASGNESSCATIVTVRDLTSPSVSCPARLDVVASATDGGDATVTASASDACGPVTIDNDRTAGGADASGRYPCGETAVTFTARDAAGNWARCTTTVSVQPGGPPSGLSPALRVGKIAGADPHATARLHWESHALRPWEWAQVRRATGCVTRPYAAIAGDPSMQGSEYLDLAATERLLYYQVHVVDCTGHEEPDPLAPSP